MPSSHDSAILAPAGKSDRLPGQIVAAETQQGIASAIADPEEYGEIDEVDANAIRRTRYATEQILGDWFPEKPPGQ
jgi:hypothetical protein